jgi:hypothetical protein
MYFDPLSPSSVARAMAKIMDESNLRDELVREGRLLLKQSVGWQEIAQRFLGVMQTAAGSGHGQTSQELLIPHGFSQ